MSERGAPRAGGAREVPPECARLAATLRELRTGTGLSLAALSTKTPYSKSSWERYLNGRSLPPRQAVEQLCALAGAESGRPLALWELAERAWSGRAGRTGQPEKVERAATSATPNGEVMQTPGVTPPRTDPARARPRKLLWLYAGILSVLALLAAGIPIVLASLGGRPVGDRAGAGGHSAPTPGCHAASCTGKGAEDLECSTAAEPPVSLGEQRLDGTMVKVRHSPVCDTVWARIDRGMIGDRVELVVPGEDIQQVQVEDDFDAMSSVSTPMVAVSDAELNHIEACLVRQGDRQCFTVAPA